MLYHYTIEITVLAYVESTYVEPVSRLDRVRTEEERIRCRTLARKVTGAETKKNNNTVAHLFFVVYRNTLLKVRWPFRSTKLIDARVLIDHRGNILQR